MDLDNLTDLLNKKKRALSCGDKDELKGIRCELKVKRSGCKDLYGKTLETKLQENNTRVCGKGLNLITGFNNKDYQQQGGSLDGANELNVFFNGVSTGPPAAIYILYLYEATFAHLKRIYKYV